MLQSIDMGEIMRKMKTFMAQTHFYSILILVHLGNLFSPPQIFLFLPPKLSVCSLHVREMGDEFKYMEGQVC
jgi:hypothetical protein